MNPSEQTLRDADRLRALVRERERGALIDLANWLHADGVPLEQFDGSLQSLVPLWVWFKAQAAAGYPAVTPGQTAIVQTYAALSPGAVLRTVVSETVAFYLMQVCRRLDPRARWDVELRYLVSDYGRPIAQFTNGQAHELFILMGNISGQLEDGTYQRDRDDSLQTVMRRRLGGDSEALTRPGPSILAALVGRVAERVDYGAIRIDIPEPEPRVAAKDLARGEYFLSINLEDLERRDENAGKDSGPEGLTPMPADAIAAFLTEARFTQDRPITAEQIREAKEYGITVAHEDYWAFAEITVAGRQPRLVRFQAWEATKPEWRGLVKQIRTFGSTIGARLTQ